MNETILKNIENKKYNEDELREYLTDLKNKGIITQAQANMTMKELFEERKVNKTTTRTPKTMEYAYSNISAGFSNTGMLVLIAMAVPALVGMVALLNK